MFFSEHEIRNNIKHYEHNNLFPQSFLEKVYSRNINKKKIPLK